MTDLTTWEACAAAGMTKAEAARHLGKTSSAATMYAQRHGVSFTVREIDAPAARAWRACAEAGMTLTEAARHLGRSKCGGSTIAKKHGFTFRKVPRVRAVVSDREPTPSCTRALLPPDQLADYDLLTRRKGYRRAEALKLIGRADLVAA